MKSLKFLFSVIVTCSTIALTSEVHAECPVKKGEEVRVTVVGPNPNDSILLGVDQAYFDPRMPPKRNFTATGIILRINALSFEPWPRELIPHDKYGPYLELQITGRLRELDQIEALFLRNAYSLGASDPVEWETEQGPFGLTVRKPRTKAGESRPARVGDDDIFVSIGKDEKIEDFIRCRRPDTFIQTPYRMCVHLIETGTFDLSLVYSTELFQNWRDISASAREFYSCIGRMGD